MNMTAEAMQVDLVDNDKSEDSEQRLERRSSESDVIKKKKSEKKDKKKKKRNSVLGSSSVHTTGGVDNEGTSAKTTSSSSPLEDAPMGTSTSSKLSVESSEDKKKESSNRSIRSLKSPTKSKDKKKSRKSKKKDNQKNNDNNDDEDDELRESNHSPRSQRSVVSTMSRKSKKKKSSSSKRDDDAASVASGVSTKRRKSKKSSSSKKDDDDASSVASGVSVKRRRSKKSANKDADSPTKSSKRGSKRKSKKSDNVADDNAIATPSESNNDSSEVVIKDEEKSKLELKPLTELEPTVANTDATNDNNGDTTQEDVTSCTADETSSEKSPSEHNAAKALELASAPVASVSITTSQKSGKIAEKEKPSSTSEEDGDDKDKPVEVSAPSVSEPTTITPELPNGGETAEEGTDDVVEEPKPVSSLSTATEQNGEDITDEKPSAANEEADAEITDENSSAANEEEEEEDVDEPLEIPPPMESVQIPTPPLLGDEEATEEGTDAVEEQPTPKKIGRSLFGGGGLLARLQAAKAAKASETTTEEKPAAGEEEKENGDIPTEISTNSASAPTTTPPVADDAASEEEGTDTAEEEKPSTLSKIFGNGNGGAAAAAPPRMVGLVGGPGGGKKRWDKLKMSARFVGSAKVNSNFAGLWKEEEEEEEDENVYLEGDDNNSQKSDAQKPQQQPKAPKMDMTAVDKRLAQIEEMEQKIAEERTKIEKEKELSAFERESIEMQLDEEIQKNEVLRRQIDENSAKTIERVESDNRYDETVLAGENEALKKRLQVEKRESEVAVQTLERAINQFKEKIASMKEDVNITNSPIAKKRGIKRMSVGMIQGELLQTKSKVAAKDLIISRQKKQLEEMFEEVIGYNEGTGLAKLEYEVAELKKRGEENASKLEKGKVDMEMKLTHKDDTIAFLIEEVGKLKKEQSEKSSVGKLPFSFMKNSRLAA